MKHHIHALRVTTISLLALGLGSGCAIVRPGEVGVKSKWGELQPEVYQPGLVRLNRFSSELYLVPTRTVNREVKLNLPSKEGLNVSAEISILYHVDAEKAESVIQEVGPEYENVLILSVFRSASADICARFFAKDMHSGKRAEIEEQIRAEMDALLSPRGFIIESVLLKSISLPAGLYTAIEDKLEAEQEAQRMQFVLQREQREAERKKIEAEGVRDAQKVLADGLTDDIIRWRSLEVLENLGTAPNSKLIITDGKAPVLVSGPAGP
jgi:regulator of protease activity HflC (stomatin/prohibitin superfamily)